jgi:hypothetical protein
MKAKLRITIATTIVLIGFVSLAHAQTSNCAVYWVIEGNIYRPTYTLIRFYTSNHLLIQEQRLVGKFLDIRKKKNRDLLDRKLNQLKCPKVEENIAGLRKKRRLH